MMSESRQSRSRDSAPLGRPSLARLRAWAGRQEREPRGRLVRLFAKSIRVLPMVARWDVISRLQLHAQALTYDTLLALVPLLVVVFAAVSGFGGGVEELRGQLESLILENISGTEEMRATVATYLHEFLQNVRTGSINAVAVVLLVYSTTSLLGHIEFAINDVFGVKTMRPWLSRLLTYWAVLTLGPLLMLASFAMTAALQSSWVAQLVDSLGLGGVLLTAVPVGVTWLAFLAMYVVVPRVRVRVGSALFAAVLAGSLWSLAKYGYAIYAKNAVTIQNIYGSLATIPLFILWVYVSWLLVLFGAQLAYAFENAATYEKDEMAHGASYAYREYVACRLLLEVARDFLSARPPTQLERVASKLAIARRLLESVADDLKTGGFVRQVEDHGLVPARDLAQVTPGDVLDWLRSGTDGEASHDAGAGQLSAILTELAREQRRITTRTSFRELVEREAAEREATGAAQLEHARAATCIEK